MALIKATVYKTNGSYQEIDLDTKTSLKTLQQLVGGYIQVILIKIQPGKPKCDRPHGEYDLIVNEEGLLLNLPVNPWSKLVALHSMWEHTAFRGDIVLVDGRLP